MNALQKLRQMVGELQSLKDPRQAAEAWALADRLLARMPVDRAAAARICTSHDLTGFDALVTSLEGPATAPRAPAAPPSVSEDDMAAALRAFRKRLKLGRLAEESKLGGRRLTGGRKSEIDAIIPPSDFPPAVWDALVRAGKLKNTGQGFYALV